VVCGSAGDRNPAALSPWVPPVTAITPPRISRCQSLSSCPHQDLPHAFRFQGLPKPTSRRIAADVHVIVVGVLADDSSAVSVSVSDGVVDVIDNLAAQAAFADSGR
jgi:hypothetical protein